MLLLSSLLRTSFEVESCRNTRAWVLLHAVASVCCQQGGGAGADSSCTVAVVIVVGHVAVSYTRSHRLGASTTRLPVQVSHCHCVCLACVTRSTRLLLLSFIDSSRLRRPSCTCDIRLALKYMMNVCGADKA